MRLLHDRLPNEISQLVSILDRRRNAQSALRKQKKVMPYSKSSSVFIGNLQASCNTSGSKYTPTSDERRA